MKLLLENWRKHLAETNLTKGDIENAIQAASFNSNNSSSHRWAVGQPYIDYWIDKNTGKWMFSAGIPDGTPNADKWPKKDSEPGESLQAFLKRVEEPVQLNLDIDKNVDEIMQFSVADHAAADSLTNKLLSKIELVKRMQGRYTLSVQNMNGDQYEVSYEELPSPRYVLSKNGSVIFQDVSANNINAWLFRYAGQININTADMKE